MPFRFMLTLVTAMGLLAVAAFPQDVSEADKGEFQRIIQSQIQAFNADDGNAAYAFAAPGIRRMFPTPEAFMGMVKQGYAPVYRQKSFRFGDTEMKGQHPVQQVTIVDAEGRTWTAYYAFEKQSDGSWLISGCVLQRIEGADV